MKKLLLVVIMLLIAGVVSLVFARGLPRQGPRRGRYWHCSATCKGKVKIKGVCSFRRSGAEKAVRKTNICDACDGKAYVKCLDHMTCKNMGTTCYPD